MSFIILIFCLLQFAQDGCLASPANENSSESEESESAESTTLSYSPVGVTTESESEEFGTSTNAPENIEGNEILEGATSQKSANSELLTTYSPDDTDKEPQTGGNSKEIGKDTKGNPNNEHSGDEQELPQESSNDVIPETTTTIAPWKEIIKHQIDKPTIKPNYTITTSKPLQVTQNLPVLAKPLKLARPLIHEVPDTNSKDGTLLTSNNTSKYLSVLQNSSVVIHKNENGSIANMTTTTEPSVVHTEIPLSSTAVIPPYSKNESLSYTTAKPSKSKKNRSRNGKKSCKRAKTAGENYALPESGTFIGMLSTPIRTNPFIQKKNSKSSKDKSERSSLKKLTTVSATPKSVKPINSLLTIETSTKPSNESLGDLTKVSAFEKATSKPEELKSTTSRSKTKTTPEKPKMEKSFTKGSKKN